MSTAILKRCLACLVKPVSKCYACRSKICQDCLQDSLEEFAAYEGLDHAKVDNPPFFWHYKCWKAHRAYMVAGDLKGKPLKGEQT